MIPFVEIRQSAIVVLPEFKAKYDKGLAWEGSGEVGDGKEVGCKNSSSFYGL
jgi:hypothetical protein